MKLNYLIREADKSVSNPKLMILLHGYGSNEQDLFSFSPDIPSQFLLVSLQAPISLSFGGFAWYEINFNDTEKFNNVEQAQNSQELIINFINELSKTYSFDSKDIWLCGFSQGAILSYSLLLNHAEKFKKGICLSGYYDKNIVGNQEKNETHNDLSIFISHGIEDTVIPIDWARNSPIYLNDLKIKNEYHEYLCGHGLNPENYSDMMKWINKKL